MTSFRFIHAADIHLDSPLLGLTRREGSAASRIRSATRDAFDGLVGRAIDERVAFLIIAGDLYDGDWRDFHTGLFFAHQMGRLAEQDIQVFLLHGNHDAESQITKRLNLPDNVKVFSARKAQTFNLPALKVALHGHSFKQQAVTDNLVPHYPEPTPSVFNIGVLHTALAGAVGHLPYAPCSLEDLKAKGYNYWALGHVHEGRILNEKPHVVFPGNLQGRHIRESGPKGARLVSVVDGEIISVAPMYCDVVRWSRVIVTVDGCHRQADVLDRIRQSIESAVAIEADGRLLACRVELTGRTNVHSELLASAEKLLAEAQAVALGLGAEAAWIERVVISTEPELDNSTSVDQDQALAELREMLARAGEDPDLLRLLADDIGELARRLPSELRAGAEDPALKAAIAGDFAAVIGLVQDYLGARLAAPME